MGCVSSTPRTDETKHEPPRIEYQEKSRVGTALSQNTGNKSPSNSIQDPNNPHNGTRTVDTPAPPGQCGYIEKTVVLGNNDPPPAAVNNDKLTANQNLETSKNMHNPDKDTALKMETSHLVLRQFDFWELENATLQFRAPDMVLGQGGFGKVYKGFVRSPGSKEKLPVAVKRLNPDSGIQGYEEWEAEIRCLGKLRHPRLIRLWGYCSHEGEAILVYEYMPAGSLDYHLFTRKEDVANGSSPPPPSWMDRLKIASHAAEALFFLHKNKTIHRDIKASNILLDKEYNAKLTDFGLVKESKDDKTHVTATKVMGTLGYLDPVYIQTGRLNGKSDVYAFGVLLLELLTGRKAIDDEHPGQLPLAQWAKSNMNIIKRKSHVLQWVDPTLHDAMQKTSNQTVAVKLAIVASHCINDNPEQRPDIGFMTSYFTELLTACEFEKHRQL